MKEKFFAGGIPFLDLSIAKSIEKLKDRLEYYDTENISYYKPWLIVLSNGENFGDMNNSVELITKMAKEGKITLDDYVGEAVSKLADGSSTEEVVFNIKEIYIQGKDNKYLRLTDVDAVVSGNDEAPLLIGQNVISNLPRHRFNDSTGVIEFDN